MMIRQRRSAYQKVAQTPADADSDLVELKDFTVVSDISRVDPGNEFFDGVLAQMLLWTKVASACFSLTAAASAIAVLLAVFQGTHSPAFGCFLLCFNCFGPLVAALGSYQWAAVQTQIDRMKHENEIYDGLIASLQTSRKQLRKEVRGIEDSVDALEDFSADLSQSSEQMGAVYSSLLESAATNEDILGIVTEVNDVFAEMKHNVLLSKKSGLLAVYYNVCFADGRKGLSERDYRRLLADLSTTDMQSFRCIGEFATIAGSDFVIDTQEFAQLVERVIGQLDSDLLSAVQ